MNLLHTGQKDNDQTISSSLIGFIYNNKKITTKKQIENLQKEDIKNILISISRGTLKLDNKYLEYIKISADKHGIKQAFCNLIFENIDKFGSIFAKGILAIIKEMASKNPDSLPKIQLTNNTTTTAFFDRASNSIMIDKKYEMDLDNLSDNIVFEYCNALNKAAFATADKIKRASGESPNVYGKTMAIIEYDTFIKYSQILEKVLENPNISIETFPCNSKNALQKYYELKSLRPIDAQKLFCETAHSNDSRSLKASLSTQDLYAYQCVENWSDMKYLRTRVNDILKQSQKTNSPIFKEALLKTKNLLKSENWPVQEYKRPHIYDNLLTKIIANFENIDESLSKNLISLKLSEKCLHIGFLSFSK